MSGNSGSGAIRFASAISDDEELGDALDEALGEVSERRGGPAEWDGRPRPSTGRRPVPLQAARPAVDLAIVFVTYHHRASFGAIAERVERELAPGAVLAVTGAGVLGSGAEIEGRPGVAVLAGRLGGAWVHPFSYEELAWDGGAAKGDAIREALLGPGRSAADAAALILFADPFSVPMVKLMPAINRALPGVPIVGGMASGAAKAGENRLLLGRRVMSEGAVGVAIGGPIRADCLVSQGCRPIGEPWVITRARHNLIQQVGQRPILQAIQATAEEADPEDRGLLRRHGMLVGRVINEYKDRFGRGDFLIRSIIGADQSSGYIAVSDLVRVGQTIQFHVRDRHTAEEDLRLLLQKQAMDGPAAGVLLCTCNGRGERLFEEANVDSSIVRAALADPPLAGFFAAGEIGPIGERNFVHGFTASMLILRAAGQ